MTNQSSISSTERKAIREYLLNIINTIDDNLYSGDMSWKLASINNSDCLIQVATYKQEVYVGAYINMERLISQFDLNDDIGAELLCIPNSQLESLSKSVDDNLLMVDKNSSLASFSLVEFIPNDAILRGLPFMQKNILLMFILCVMFLPILIVFLRGIVIKPLLILTKAMNHIHNGDMDYRIPPYHTSNELNLVNHTFNEMINQVQNLKIVVYEEKIKVQRSQLRNLQLQIKPHFLINSLNMVYNLISNEDYDTANKLIRYSVNYFRYMVKVDEDFVPLNEEIEHVKAFLEIQTIRYKDKFSYSIDIDQQIDDMLIPPVLIQSFVENSMKYALQMSDQVHINISVNSFEVEYYPYAKIVISDSGPGYPSEYLPLLNQGKKIIDINGEHIGIRNVVQRLDILFNSKAKWYFYNNNGAVSEIIIPATFINE
jgi:two-component system sensor histidine kinase YesM